MKIDQSLTGSRGIAGSAARRGAAVAVAAAIASAALLAAGVPASAAPAEPGTVQVSDPTVEAGATPAAAVVLDSHQTSPAGGDTAAGEVGERETGGDDATGADADPGSPRLAPIELETGPGAPIPYADSAFSYLATSGATHWLSDNRVPQLIGSLPVPGEFRPAHDALTDRLDGALDEAVGEPGACLQVVLDPAPGAGMLFDYGFFPVAPEYCP